LNLIVRNCIPVYVIANAVKQSVCSFNLWDCFVAYSSQWRFNSWDCFASFLAMTVQFMRLHLVFR